MSHLLVKHSVLLQVLFHALGLKESCYDFRRQHRTIFNHYQARTFGSTTAVKVISLPWLPH